MSTTVRGLSNVPFAIEASVSRPIFATTCYYTQTPFLNKLIASNLDSHPIKSIDSSFSNVLSIDGDRPHECEICQKRFALQCNLRAHMKTHEEPQTEKCLRCSREYPISTGLVTMGCCHECYLNNQGIPLLRQK
ncbi:hypothetical protein BLOT_012270, partial [Blomia tropicalis]